MVSVGILERDPLLIVDLRRDDAAIADIKSTYSFVDWSRAELHLDGFGPAVLDWLREREEEAQLEQRRYECLLQDVRLT